MATIDEIRSNMLAKYRWAQTSVNRIKENRRTATDLTEQDFWAFLAACQTIRFYHGALCKHIDKSGKSTEWIDNWKKTLTDEELNAWEAISSMRNMDTHHVPVSPSDEIKLVSIDLQPELRHMTDNKPMIVVHTNTNFNIVHNKIRYNLPSICQYGLDAYRKFIADVFNDSYFNK